MRRSASSWWAAVAAAAVLLTVRVAVGQAAAPAAGKRADTRIAGAPTAGMGTDVRIAVTPARPPLAEARPTEPSRRLQPPFRAHRAHATSPALRRAAMVGIPGGSYLPLYAPMGRVRVAGFALDRYPVTRAQYAAFLATHPEWRRSRAPRALGGGGYLRDWRGDLDFGGGAAAQRPVTWVSRPAAAAYCAAAGARLPTTDEWEYVASASPTRRDGVGDPAFQQQLIELYTRPRPSEPGPVGSTFRNAFGVYDLHGLVWEWTDGSPAGAMAQPAGMAMHGAAGADAPHAPRAPHDMGCAGSAAGATDTRAYAAFLRYALRAGLTPTTDLGSLGFRGAS